MKFTKEEISMLITAIEMYDNGEKQYKSLNQHNIEVTQPLLKKLREYEND